MINRHLGQGWRSPMDNIVLLWQCSNRKSVTYISSSPKVATRGRKYLHVLSSSPSRSSLLIKDLVHYKIYYFAGSSPSCRRCQGSLHQDLWYAEVAFVLRHDSDHCVPCRCGVETRFSPQHAGDDGCMQLGETTATLSHKIYHEIISPLMFMSTVMSICQGDRNIHIYRQEE